MSTMRNFAGGALALVALSACATKGYVMKQIQAANDTSRMAWTAGDTAVRSELSGQISTLRTDVDSVKRSVADLNRELTVLRDSLGAQITAMANGMRFALPVTFAFDDATVQERDRPTLDRFAKVVDKYYGGSLVTVEGFADPAGSQAYNKRLSTQRAENVVAYLQQNGLSGVTLRPVGMGKTRLVVEGASRDMPGAEANRRVVFVVETASSSSTNTTAAR
jgi:peptidoglycan-associated lipoprotein